MKCPYVLPSVEGVMKCWSGEKKITGNMYYCCYHLVIQCFMNYLLYLIMAVVSIILAKPAPGF